MVLLVKNFIRHEVESSSGHTSHDFFFLVSIVLFSYFYLFFEFGLQNEGYMFATFSISFLFGTMRYKTVYTKKNTFLCSISGI